jgi:hypothetical protein
VFGLPRPLRRVTTHPMRHAVLKILGGVLVLCPGCSQVEPNSVARAPAAVTVLATINDVPITETDLRLHASKASAHEDGTLAPREPTDHRLDPGARRDALEAIVREELMAQRAVELGLDADPAVAEELATRQAELDAHRRQRLAELYARHERANTKVTEQEARRYYEENEAQMRRDLHVLQILVRDPARIEEARRSLAAGTPFEEVAARIFPALPANLPRPWDLGFLNWAQLPPAWRPAVRTLHEGQTSGVLRGPRNRFWIIQIADERPSTTASFATFRSSIEELLRTEQVDARRVAAEQALRARARVTFSDGEGR